MAIPKYNELYPNVLNVLSVMEKNIQSMKSMKLFQTS